MKWSKFLDGNIEISFGIRLRNDLPINPASKSRCFGLLGPKSIRDLLVPQLKSSDSGFHRELKVFLRLYVTRFPGERIRNSSEVCRISALIHFWGRRRELRVSKEKAPCGLLGDFSGEIRERTN
jgi:hypothetical protein